MAQLTVAASWDELPSEIQILVNRAGIWGDSQRRLAELREQDLKGIRRQGGSVDKTIDLALEADENLREALRCVEKLRRRWAEQRVDPR